MSEGPSPIRSIAQNRYNDAGALTQGPGIVLSQGRVLGVRGVDVFA